MINIGDTFDIIIDMINTENLLTASYRQLQSSMKQHGELVQVSEYVSKDPQTNLKLIIQFSDRTMAFIKKAGGVRRHCNDSIQNCTKTEPAKTLTQQNVVRDTGIVGNSTHGRE